MIKGSDGERLTPTQAAKEIIMDAASHASYWPEGFMVDNDALTDGERKRINDALDKQWQRLQRLLGYEGWKLQ